MAAKSFKKLADAAVFEMFQLRRAVPATGNVAKQSIDSLEAAAEHIRDCERCRRVYAAACDAVKRYVLAASTTAGGVSIPASPGLHPRFVLEECSRELHEC